MIDEADIYIVLDLLTHTQATPSFRPQATFTPDDYEAIAAQCCWDTSLLNVTKQTAIHYCKNAESLAKRPVGKGYQDDYLKERDRAENIAIGILKAIPFDINYKSSYGRLLSSFFGNKQEIVGQNVYKNIVDIVACWHQEADEKVKDLKQELGWHKPTIFNFLTGF